MGFGKDQSNLTNVGSWRQKAHHATASRQKRAGGGRGAPTWIDRFKPSTDDPDTIRIIPGDYDVQQCTPDGNIEVVKQPFFVYGEHFHATLEKGSVCSAGPLYNWKDKRQPCYACDLFWQGMQPDPVTNKKKRGPMSRRDMSSFTVIHFHPYHKVEQTDRSTGQVRMNESTGVPFYNWVKCEGRGCEMCRAQKEISSAHRLHWDMGTGHFNTLLEYEKEVGKGCLTCGGRNALQLEALVCRGPGCGEPKVVMNETNLKPKEIDELFNSLSKCDYCGHEGFLAEIISCKNCTPAGRDPRRATLFDVDLDVKRVEDASGNSNQTTLIVTQWSDPHPIDPVYAELAKPINLDKVFLPTPLDAQAVLYNLGPQALADLKAGNAPRGRQPVTPGSASRPYSK
jgi:hypothetical protein